MFKIKRLKMITLTSEQVTKIKKIKDAQKRGYFVKGSDVTPLYNDVFDKDVKNTSCGSCIKNRSIELIKALDDFMLWLEQEEKKQEEQLQQQPIEDTKITEIKKRGRPKK